MDTQLYRTTTNILYLIPPRKFHPQLRTALVYTFDDRFLNRAEDIMARGSQDRTGACIEDILYSGLGSQLIKPYADVGDLIRMDQLGDYWTFLLIVDNDAPAPVASYDSPLLQNPGVLQSQFGENRVVYYGFCLGEAVSPLSLQAPEPVINWQSPIYVTHRTFVSRHDSYGPMGRAPTRFDVVANQDFVDPGMMNLISTAPDLYRLTPDQLFHGFETFRDPSGLIDTADFGGTSPINAKAARFAVDSQHADPKEHMKNLLYGVANAGDTVKRALSINAYTPETDILRDDDGVDTEVVEDSISSRFRPQNALDHVGLSPTGHITLETVRTRYQPHVQVFSRNRDVMSEVRDDLGATSPSALYSSLIVQAGMHLLQSSGLVSITLTYNSWSGILEPQTFAPVANMDETTQIERVRAFLSEFKRRILDPISEGGRHFNLNLSLQGSDVSRVVLNFLDDTMHTDVPFETASIAGGLGTSLVGTEGPMDQNTSGLNALVQRMTGSGTLPAPPPNPNMLPL